MSVLKPLVIAATLLMAAGAAHAQSDKLKIEPRLAAPSAAPGDSIEVTFRVELKKGYHLYPPGETQGVPVSVKLDPPVPGITFGALVAKSGVHELEVEGLGKMKVLEGTCDLALRVLIAKDAALGPRKLAGALNYQLCDDKTCEFPKDHPFELSLDVAPPSVGVGPAIELPDSGPVIANLTGPASVPAGGKGTIDLEVFVRPRYHIYAPGTDGETRVTQLELELPPGFTAGALVAPAPHKSEKDELGKANLWEGKVKLSRSFTAPAGAQGTAKITARARWMVCDDKGCMPGSEEKELLVAVEPSNGAVAVVDSGANATSPPSTEGPAVGTLILTAISLGLLNVLMPCTLPMIPITISIFSKGKKLTRGQSLFRASTYALGIILSFALVGGVIQAAFGNAGQGFVRVIAANGPLNLAIGALFVYFALSFFGYFEVQLPEFLRAFVEKSVDKAKATAPGEAGIPLPALFLMGFFFVLTSYTCGAPLILGVLTAGLATPAKGSVILACAVFGATTAAPFFALALVPGFLKSLPRSGSWFKTFKVVLGLVEIAAALKFFSNADLYWRAHLLTRSTFVALWVVCGVLIVLFVAHVIRFAHDEEATEPGPKLDPKAWLRAAPFILATCYVASALDGRNIPPEAPGLAHLRHEVAANFESFLPPEPYPGEKPVAGAAHGPVPVYDDYAQAVAAAKKSGKRLFLEFTGHQCINCRKMEVSVLVNPKVQKIFERLEPASLFTDANTEPERANLKTQTEKFGGAVIPAYYVVDPSNDKILAEKVGACSVEEFVEFLEKGLR